MARSKGKWVRRSAEEWRALLVRFEDGDLGVEAFCRRQGISTASFHRWRKLLSARADAGNQAGAAESPAFVDLGALSAGTLAGTRLDLKLDLGGGLTLHLVRA